MVIQQFMSHVQNEMFIQNVLKFFTLNEKQIETQFMEDGLKINQRNSLKQKNEMKS